MKHRLSLVVTALAGIAILMLSACSSTYGATDWFFGEALAIRVKEIRLVEEVRYSHDEKHYLIQPSQEGRTLAVAYLEVWNREANVAYFSVNKDAIRLRDTAYLDYRAIDPIQERGEVAEAGPTEDTITRFIWGDVELPQKCGEINCKLEGWVLFEVPRDIKFYQLIWDTGDTIYLYF